MPSKEEPPDLLDQLRPLFTAEEWPEVAPDCARVQRNREIKCDVEAERERGRTVRRACLEVGEQHGLSPSTVQAIYYGQR